MCALYGRAPAGVGFLIQIKGSVPCSHGKSAAGMIPPADANNPYRITRAKPPPGWDFASRLELSVPWLRVDVVFLLG